ncbi:hypothetical protein MKX01_025952 [Papaver californicum]|nr:hypothetical protein MKX01_025952 [Papaver californicum]
MKKCITSLTFLAHILLVFHLNLIFLHITHVFSASLAPIPTNKVSLQSWFVANILSFEKCEADFDPTLVTAEKNVIIIKVHKDGSGQFKTLTEVVNSIPKENTKRTIIWIDTPTLTFNGTNKQYGTVFSGSVCVYSKYFMAVNIIFENSASMPIMGKTEGGQAVALTLFEDNAALYNCKFKGFQDTLSLSCLMQNTEIKAIWDPGGVITSHGRKKPPDDTGYTFVHCSISGVSNGKTYLGRLWKPLGKTVFLYTDMSIVGRVKFTKKLTDAEAKLFLDLNYIGAAKWILPPPQVK